MMRPLAPLSQLAMQQAELAHLRARVDQSHAILNAITNATSLRRGLVVCSGVGRTVTCRRLRRMNASTPNDRRGGPACTRQSIAEDTHVARSEQDALTESSKSDERQGRIEAEQSVCACSDSSPCSLSFSFTSAPRRVSQLNCKPRRGRKDRRVEFESNRVESSRSVDCAVQR